MDEKTNAVQTKQEAVNCFPLLCITPQRGLVNIRYSRAHKESLKAFTCGCVDICVNTAGWLSRENTLMRDAISRRWQENSVISRSVLNETRLPHSSYRMCAVCVRGKRKSWITKKKKRKHTNVFTCGAVWSIVILHHTFEGTRRSHYPGPCSSIVSMGMSTHTQWGCLGAY